MSVYATVESSHRLPQPAAARRGGAKLSVRRLSVSILCAAALTLLFNAAFAHGPGGYESTLDEAPANSGAASGMFMSEELARSLGAIQALMGKNQLKEAVQRLEKLDARSGAYNNYENAVLHQNLGYAYAAINDYAKAAEAFEECLSFKALPKETTRSVMQNLGQLYLVSEQYDKGISILESWIGQSGDKVSPQIRVLLGNAYLHKQAYAKAVSELKQAIAGVGRPQKSWIQLLAATYQQWDHTEETADTLEQGLMLYPDEKPFWQQLVMAYRQMHDDKKATAALALSCNAVACDAKDLTYLARLYLYVGAPIKAADLLVAALQDGRLKGEADDWQLLALSWQQARELDRAEQAYLEAAKRNKASGDSDFRLGQIYLQQGKWQAAADALTEGLKKGSLSSPGRAQLMLGISHYYLGHTQQAMAAVEAATRYRDVEKEARRWQQQLRSTPVAEKTGAARKAAAGG